MNAPSSGDRRESPGTGPGEPGSADRGVPTALRPVRLAEAPTMSVVLAWRGDEGALDHCLEALVPEAASLGIEVVVATPSGARTGSVRRRHAQVVFVEASGDDTYAGLRATGMAFAAGDVVAVADERRPPEAHWMRDVARGVSTSAEAVRTPRPPASREGVS